MPWPSLLAPSLRLWGTLEGPGSPGPNSCPDGKTLSTMSSRFFESRFLLDSTCFVLRWNTLPEPINRTRRKGDHAADGTSGWSGSSVVFRGGARLRLRTPPLPFACVPRPTAAERFIHGPPFLSSRRPRKGLWEWGCRANKRRILRWGPENHLLPPGPKSHPSKFPAKRQGSLPLEAALSDLHSTPPDSSGNEVLKLAELNNVLFRGRCI